DAQTLSEERSVSPILGWLTSAVYMVGTPAKLVIFFLATSASTRSASKRMCITSSAPVATESSMMKDRPKMWNSGSTTSVLSAPSVVALPTQRLRALTTAQKLAWVSIAPL